MTQRVGGGTAYGQTFDAENRLVSVTVGVSITHFVYDGNGQRVLQVAADGSQTAYVGELSLLGGGL